MMTHRWRGVTTDRDKSTVISTMFGHKRYTLTSPLQVPDRENGEIVGAEI